MGEAVEGPCRESEEGLWKGPAGRGRRGGGGGLSRSMVQKSKPDSCAALRARPAAKLVGTARVPSPDRKHPAPARGGACARCAGWGRH